MKQNDKRTNIRPAWDAIIAAIAFLIAGPIFIFKGIAAHETGTLVPPGHKHSWLAWYQAITIGSTILLLGIGLLINEGIKAKKRKHQS